MSSCFIKYVYSIFNCNKKNKTFIFQDLSGNKTSTKQNKGPNKGRRRNENFSLVSGPLTVTNHNRRVSFNEDIFFIFIFNNWFNFHLCIHMYVQSNFINTC